MYIIIYLLVHFNQRLENVYCHLLILEVLKINSS